MFDALNYKHKLRKIPAKYWSREVTDENYVLFLFSTYLVEPGSAGHRLDPGQLGFQDHHQGLQCHPPSSNLHQNTIKNCMTWNFPLPWIPINVVLSRALFWISQTPKYIFFKYFWFRASCFIVCEISPTRGNNCVFILRNGFYSTCFGR